jgi:hypothetical protein
VIDGSRGRAPALVASAVASSFSRCSRDTILAIPLDDERLPGTRSAGVPSEFLGCSTARPRLIPSTVLVPHTLGFGNPVVDFILLIRMHLPHTCNLRYPFLSIAYPCARERRMARAPSVVISTTFWVCKRCRRHDSTAISLTLIKYDHFRLKEPST